MAVASPSAHSSSWLVSGRLSSRLVQQRMRSRLGPPTFRRGSGVDILESHGVAAMVAHGEWADPRAARPYASADEQRAVSVAAALLSVDNSDDDLD